MGEPVTALTLVQVRLGLLVVPSRAGGRQRKAGCGVDAHLTSGHGLRDPQRRKLSCLEAWASRRGSRNGEGAGILASLPGVSLG